MMIHLSLFSGRCMKCSFLTVIAREEQCHQERGEDGVASVLSRGFVALCQETGEPAGLMALQAESPLETEGHSSSVPLQWVAWGEAPGVQAEAADLPFGVD